WAAQIESVLLGALAPKRTIVLCRHTDFGFGIELVAKQTQKRKRDAFSDGGCKSPPISSRNVAMKHTAEGGPVLPASGVLPDSARRCQFGVAGGFLEALNASDARF